MPPFVQHNADEISDNGCFARDEPVLTDGLWYVVYNIGDELIRG